MSRLNNNLQSSRSDGTRTKAMLIDAAGIIFAERGYVETTGKDICSLAKTNSAAINYHFGGKDNLYAEVLIQAHKQLISLEDVESVYRMTSTPEEKLQLLITKLLASSSSSNSWGPKIFLRELLSPSPILEKNLVPAVLQKVFFVKKIIAEVIDYEDSAPETQRALTFTMLPLFSLILFPEKTRLRVLPNVSISSPELSEELLAYIMAGLSALKRSSRFPLPPNA